MIDLVVALAAALVIAVALLVMTAAALIDARAERDWLRAAYRAQVAELAPRAAHGGHDPLVAAGLDGGEAA